MALTDSINKARTKNISDDDIITTIERAMPQTVSGFSRARKGGSDNTKILNELIKRSGERTSSVESVSREDELRKRIKDRGRTVPSFGGPQEVTKPQADKKPKFNAGEDSSLIGAPLRVGGSVLSSAAQGGITGATEPFERGRGEGFLGGQAADLEETKRRFLGNIKRTGGGLLEVAKGIKQGKGEADSFLRFMKGEQSFAETFPKSDEDKTLGSQRIGRGLSDFGLGALGTVFSVLPTLLPDQAEALLGGVFGTVGGAFEGGTKQVFKEMGIDPEGEDARRLIEISTVFGQAKTGGALLRKPAEVIASRFSKEGKAKSGTEKIKGAIRAKSRRGRTSVKVSEDMKVVGDALIRENQVPKEGAFDPSLGRNKTHLETMETVNIPNVLGKIGKQIEDFRAAAGKTTKVFMKDAADLLRKETERFKRTFGGKEKAKELESFRDDILGIERDSTGKVTAMAKEGMSIEGAENVIRSISEQINKVGANTLAGRTLIKVKNSLVEQIEGFMKGNKEIRNEYRALKATQEDLRSVNLRIGNEAPFSLAGQGGRLVAFRDMATGLLQIAKGEGSAGFTSLGRSVATLLGSKVIEGMLNPNIRLRKGFGLLEKSKKGGGLKPGSKARQDSLRTAKEQATKRTKEFEKQAAKKIKDLKKQKSDATNLEIKKRIQGAIDELRSQLALPKPKGIAKDFPRSIGIGKGVIKLRGKGQTKKGRLTVPKRGGKLKPDRQKKK